MCGVLVNINYLNINIENIAIFKVLFDNIIEKRAKVRKFQQKLFNNLSFSSTVNSMNNSLITLIMDDIQ